MRFSLLFKLVAKDLWQDRKVSFFIVSALMAVIAPLLLLFSLKFGIVSKLQQDLVNDPQNLEIKMDGLNYNLDDKWLNEIKNNLLVQFVVPLTRALNMQADVRSTHTFERDVLLIPTAEKDPLIPENMVLSQDKGIILSALIAEKLQVQQGDNIDLFFSRKLEGVEQKASMTLMVENVLPERYFNRKGAFVRLPILVEIENFLDGYQVSHYVNQPITSGKALETPRRTYSKARIYAADLDSVLALSAQLRDQGISTLTQANAIANVKSIDKVLTILFVIIAITSIIGAILSLSGSFLANIERKRKEISLLYLFGLKPSELKVYLMMQSLLLSSAAFVLAFILFMISSTIINTVFSQHLSEEIFLSVLLPIHYLIAFLATNSVAVVVAILGGSNIGKIQPAEILREV
ncbi:ABC transporter permease [Frederiksenia canicola]|uniref:ABC transport system permease protein n=1 Tax=Frederiksenia canicola TaxID=123824 RepID=A0AAE6X4S5_9PAST|nr:ABC transporter permease [Frederiksenia canicola]QIM64161.1 hypothetical protein A4G17_01180 [Frederiksenia canicola]RPE93696.1 putative ABC transport system permease protein [Frederiksenia canicola]